MIAFYINILSCNGGLSSCKNVGYGRWKERKNEELVKKEGNIDN